MGEVISRFERKGFKLVALKMQTATRGLAEEHYNELSAKPFFKDLVDYIISGPVICMVGAPWHGLAHCCCAASAPITSGLICAVLDSLGVIDSLCRCPFLGALPYTTYQGFVWVSAATQSLV